MKKRNCRKTDIEREQHDRAIRVRKMTDAQLCEYLDGLLLRLPAPIGSTVWRVRQNPACHYGVREAEKFLFGRVVTPRRIVEPVPFTLLLLDEWGRTVFLTKHEADKMLGKEEDTE